MIRREKEENGGDGNEEAGGKRERERITKGKGKRES